MLRQHIRRGLAFLLLSALYGCVPVFGTPVSLPPKLEAQRDTYEADLGLAFATVNRFAAKHGWDVKAEDVVVDLEVFESQQALWRRLLELEGLPQDTKLPLTGLAATLEGGHLLAVSPGEYRRLHPEYSRGDAAWAELLAHELVHGLHAAILRGNNKGMGPVWFYEGLAVVGAGQPFGLDRRFESDRAALGAVNHGADRPKGSYATYAAVVRHFMRKIPLRELVRRAGDPGFEHWLAARQVALLTESGSPKFTH